MNVVSENIEVKTTTPAPRVKLRSAKRVGGNPKRKTSRLYYKNPRSAPTLYQPEYCEDIIKFFDRPLYIKKTQRKWVDGEEQIIESEVPNETPYLVSWCMKIGVSTSAVKDWAEKHENFGIAYNRAKELQERFLAELGIKGDHSGFMTFKALQNISGWRDKESDQASFTNIVVNNHVQLKASNGQG